MNKTTAVEKSIYLASNSPRRQELLHQIGVSFDHLSVEIDESRKAGETPSEYVVRMAMEKADAGLTIAHDSKPILAADTTVVSGNDCLGKPQDEEHAKTMLRQLSGATHSVISAVAVFANGEQHCLSSLSHITFRTISDAEISDYWRSGEPSDKAGAYAIQGKGALFVTGLVGSYSGVVGLPLHETEQLLARVGISCWN
ncbi:MAG: nucleoside triphosphate pyrophosphatase [Pseudomonadales bacterium]